MIDEDEDPNQFLPDEHSDQDRLFVEIPGDRQPPHPEKIPSGYDPMGEIYLRGRAYRGLASGGIPWWVLTTGWIIFGGFALFVLVAAIASGSFAALSALFIPAIFIMILWRGTNAKLSSKKRKSRRK